MNLTKESKRIIACSCVLNYAIYIFMRLFFYSTYESQLDIMMQAAVCGVSGTKTAYILYSNVIIGWILKGLTTIFPFINWYFAFLCGCVLCALSVIGYVIVRRTNNKIGWTVAVVLSSFMGYECYVLPGYMKTASVLGLAMLVVAADYLERENGKSRKWEVLIVLLAVLSSMVSFSVFLITVLIGLTGLLSCYVLKNIGKIRAWIKKERDMNKETIKRAALLCGCIFIGTALFRTVDCAVYHMSGQEDAAKYRSAMVRMYGYGMGDYDDSYAEKYGIDSVEYAAIKNGSFAVVNETGWEKLEELSKERRKISGTALNSYFKNVPISFFKYGIFYLYVVIMFMLFFSPVKKKSVIIWTQIALLFVVFFVLYVFHSWQNNWTVFVVVLSLLLPMLLALKGGQEKDYQYLWVYLAVFSIILYSKFSSGMVSSVSEESMSEKFSALNSEQVNLVDLNNYFRTFSAQRIYTAGVLQNESVTVTNGAYALMEGFEHKVLSEYPLESAGYEWIYNSKNLSVWDLVFED